MENKTVYQVIIIGGGPAGLTLGYYLKKAAVNFLILEKGSQAADSWSKMPDHLHLISYWRSNYLIEADSDCADLNKAHSAKDFFKYLSEFSERHSLPLQKGCEVVNVSGQEGNFTLTTKDGRTFHSLILVDCRGYYSFPWMPDYQTHGALPKMLHFNDFKNAAQFSDCKSICIVGKRLSAGQVISELSESDPSKKIYLSTRSRLHFSPSMKILNVLLRFLNVLEWLPLKMKIKKSADIPMHSSAKKYFEKNVEVMGDILKVEDKKVFFPQGSRDVDAIIFATGYKREEINLRDDFESDSEKGRFYLGLNSQRTFTSRFLRGIRADAPVLAQLILGRLASRNNCQ